MSDSQNPPAETPATIEVPAQQDLNSCRLAWVDTETTGLNPFAPTSRDPGGWSRVIDICVILTDPHLNVLDSFETKIALAPEDRARFHPKAMEVNGFTDQEWEGAPANSIEIWKRVHALTNKAFLCGHNVGFDAKFLEAEMGRFRLRPGWDRRMVDTTCHSIRLMQTMGLDNAKLEVAYPAVGGPVLPPHRAKGDVLRSMFLHYSQYISRDGRSPDGSGASFMEMLNEHSRAYAASLAKVA